MSEMAELMTTKPYLRPLLLGQICIILLLSCRIPAVPAIGIYNFTATAVGGALPITIEYRLNNPGDVTIEICNADGATVATLGPFEDESAGLHSHTWDNGGAALPGGTYRARIRATSEGSGEPGTLVSMFNDKRTLASVYGLAIDRFPESPGYGTIYVSKTYGTSAFLEAYYADGTPKNWECLDPPSSNLLLGAKGSNAIFPCGIGVDRLGNIYVSNSTVGVAMAGVSIYDYKGNRLPEYVLRTDPAGIVWLDGLATATGLEIYETKGTTVRYSAFLNDEWATVMDPGVRGTSVATHGISFEPGGTACYVATGGTSSDPENPNPGVTRFVRQPDGTWAKDNLFACGLGEIVVGVRRASYYTRGVSCDARDPDGDGPATATNLWVGLEIANSQCGGNLVRIALPSGAMTQYQNSEGKTRFVAADSVGNVAYENNAGTGSLWMGWCMASPGGESSADERLTNWVSIAGSAETEIVETIKDLKQQDSGTLIELSSACCVTAVFDGYFYIQDNDRVNAIRVECATPVEEGTLVRVRGRLDSQNGERYLADAEILTP